MSTHAAWKQKSIRFRHGIANALGRPVDYEPFEFRRRKQKLDWSRIPEDRIRLVSTLFAATEDRVRSWVTEAEAIQTPEKEHEDQEWFEGVGAPMGRTDRITLYTVLRAFQPERVVETGTGAGSAALYIPDGHGAEWKRPALLSVDATPDRRHVGRLVPERLRSRMQVYSGTSEEILPRLAVEAGSIDFFLHDSSHRYNAMTSEFEWAFNQIKERVVICAHDVLMTNAWDHFVKRHRLRRHGVVKNLGVAAVQRPTCR